MRAFLSAFAIAEAAAAPKDVTITQIANTILEKLVEPFISFLLVAATVVFLYGVIEYIAQGDNEEARTTGKRHMMWGIVGLVIMVGAASIVYIFKNFWEGFS